MFVLQSRSSKCAIDVPLIDCFLCEEWTPGVYSALHAIRDSRSISPETANAVHEYLLSEILVQSPTVSGEG